MPTSLNLKIRGHADRTLVQVPKLGWNEVDSLAFDRAQNVWALLGLEGGFGISICGVSGV